jgi:hypothetical protein
VEVKRIVGGHKQRLLSRWPRWPCAGEHAEDDDFTASEKKFEAVSVYVAYWAELMDWSDGLCRLGCGPLAVSFFFLFLSFLFSVL